MISQEHPEQAEPAGTPVNCCSTGRESKTAAHFEKPPPSAFGNRQSEQIEGSEGANVSDCGCPAGENQVAVGAYDPLPTTIFKDRAGMEREVFPDVPTNCGVDHRECESSL